MAWLKLTNKSLYLMEKDRYRKKIDLREHNGTPALDIPLEWFKEDVSLPRVVSISNDGEPLPMPQPKFSGNDLASRILRYMQEKNYKIFEGAREYNIVYVEGMHTNGTLNNDEFNQFNDIRLVIEILGGKPKIVGGPWEATTEPGDYYTDNPFIPEKGAARIEFGQYTAWQIDIHNNDHKALVQSKGEISVCRDLNKDGARTNDIVDTGNFWINQHHGYNNPKDNVGRASAGCLVGRTVSEHEAFMRLIEQDRRYQESRDFVFTTTVIPGNALS